jgi:hypothetical protein
MPIILPKGREIDWLKPSNHLSTILHMMEPYPVEKMNAYPISKDIELSGPYTSDILKPVGERLYAEVEKKFIPQRHYGHKLKGAGSGTWRGNVV